MATPGLDISLLRYFKPAFTWIFIYVFLFAILEKTEILSKNKSVNVVASLALSVLFMLTPGVPKIVDIMTPWFIVMFILITLIVVLFLFIGVETSAVVGVFKESWLIWTIAIFSIVGIFGYALSQVYGPVVQGIYGTEETAKEGITYDIGRIIFHPRFLGVIFILIVASQAVRLISGGSS